MCLIPFGHRLFSDVRRKMTYVKLSTIWTKFRIVLEEDLFLSNKEHTRFPSILLGGDVPFLPMVLRAGWVSVLAGEAAGWSGAGRGCWDWGRLEILLDPRLSRMFPGLKEEGGQKEAVNLPELIATLGEISSKPGAFHLSLAKDRKYSRERAGGAELKPCCREEIGRKVYMTAEPKVSPEHAPFFFKHEYS